MGLLLIQFGNTRAARKGRFFFVLRVPVLIPTEFLIPTKKSIATPRGFLLVFP